MRFCGRCGAYGEFLGPMCPSCTREWINKENKLIEEREREREREEYNYRLREEELDLEREKAKHVSRIREQELIFAREQEKNREKLQLNTEISKIAYLDKHDTEKIKNIINLTLDSYPSYIEYIYNKIKLLGKEFESIIIDLLYEKIANEVNNANIKYFDFYKFKKTVSFQEKCFHYFYKHLLNVYKESYENYQYDFYLKKIIDRNIVLQIINDLTKSTNVNLEKLNSEIIKNNNLNYIKTLNKELDFLFNLKKELNVRLSNLEKQYSEIDNMLKLLDNEVYYIISFPKLLLISIVIFFIKYSLNIKIYSYYHIIIFTFVGLIINIIYSVNKKKKVSKEKFNLEQEIIDLNREKSNLTEELEFYINNENSIKQKIKDSNYNISIRGTEINSEKSKLKTFINELNIIENKLYS